jgi:hypothetical protein
MILYITGKKFKPDFSDEEIKNMIQIPKEKLVKCQNDIWCWNSWKRKHIKLASIKNNWATLVQAEEHAIRGNLFRKV